MASRCFSAHQIPGGVCFSGTCKADPSYVWDWFPVVGINGFGAAGENLWQAPLLTTDFAEIANRVFSDSPSHYSAMVSPDFTHCGVGMAPYPCTFGAHVVEVYWRPVQGFEATSSLTVETSGQRGFSAARARR